MAKKFKTAIDQIEFERCRRDPHYFIFEQVRTKDEHDAADPVKRFPDHLYLRSLLDCLLVSGRLLPPADAKYAIEAGHSETWLTAPGTSGILMVEKSRQVMATWICCAYLLWRAKFRDHQLILVQSKKEEDAANLVFNGEAWVARMSFMEVNLPPPFIAGSAAVKAPPNSGWKAASSEKITEAVLERIMSDPSGQPQIREPLSVRSCA